MLHPKALYNNLPLYASFEVDGLYSGSIFTDTLSFGLETNSDLS